MLDKSTAKMLARAEPILARLRAMPRRPALSAMPPGPDGPCVVVEVGVNRGQLGEHLLEQCPGLTWHGVDPWWDGPSHSSPSYVSTRDGHAVQSFQVSTKCYEEAVRRVQRFGHRALIHRMPSPGAATAFAPASADLVFIDGDHSYEGVRADIEAWWPIVKPGGWLGGDDYRFPGQRFDFSGIERAVDAFATGLGLEVELDDPPPSEVIGAALGFTWFVRKPCGSSA